MGFYGEFYWVLTGTMVRIAVLVLRIVTISRLMGIPITLHAVRLIRGKIAGAAYPRLSMYALSKGKIQNREE